jgi:hypothetical protein
MRASSTPSRSSRWLPPMISQCPAWPMLPAAKKRADVLIDIDIDWEDHIERMSGSFLAIAYEFETQELGLAPYGES